MIELDRPHRVLLLGEDRIPDRARRLPVRAGAMRSARVPRPLWFASVGLVANFIFFVIIFWGLPELAVPAPITMLAAVALVALVAWMVRWMSRGGAWNDEHRLALAGGALTLFILMAPLQELDETRIDNTTGMTVAGLATLVFLLWLWRRVRRTIVRQAPIAGAPASLM